MSTIEPLNQPWRIVTLAVNVVLAWLIYVVATGSYLPTGSGASVWLLAATSYWLLTLVAAPFFVPPRDALITSIAVLLLLAPLDFSGVVQWRTTLAALNGVAVAFAVGVTAVALVAIFQQPNRAKPLGRISYRLSSVLGQGEVLFTPAVMISALGFYQGSPSWMATILAAWTFAVIVKPVELLLRIAIYLRGYGPRSIRERAGTILRVDDPGVVRVTLAKDASSWRRETVHLTRLPDGTMTYVLPLFSQVQNEEVVGTGLCCSIGEDISADAEVGGVCVVPGDGLAARLGSALSGETTIHEVAGIVVEGSSIANIRF